MKTVMVMGTLQYFVIVIASASEAIQSVSR
jgi:hypothetical protein